LNAKHQDELSDLRKKYDEEKKKANEDLIKLRTDFAAEKARALQDLRTKLKAEFMTEKTSLVNASRITLDFHSQSVYAKEVVQKLISVGAVPVDSVDKGILLRIVLYKLVVRVQLVDTTTFNPLIPSVFFRNKVPKKGRVSQENEVDGFWIILFLVFVIYLIL
jgi:hypothetical protein